LTVAVGLLAGCATLPRRPAPAPDPALAGWEALGDGRRGDASRLFAARLAADPSDPVALFGRATVAFARGGAANGLDDDVAALRALAAPSARALSPALRAVAAVAAGRVRELWGELGAAERARVAATLQPVTLARSPRLPWLARVELARVGDELAREADDADLLARTARAVGCAESAFEVATLGPFAHLDLDRPHPARAPGPDAWRPLIASGCRLDVPQSAEGRGDARLLRAAVDASAGDYDVVLDFGDEARVEIDGRTALVHGSARHYGPRLSAVRVSLPAGRHDLTLRIASNPGQTRLALYLLPVEIGAGATFVDPRGARAGGGGAVLRQASDDAVPASSAGETALADYCAAYAALRRGAVDETAAALARLGSQRRFAVGLALAGEIAREDPTRPAASARDAARQFLRRAVAVDPELRRAWQSLATAEMEDERPREALADARQAAQTADGGWWAPELLLARILAARGLEVDAAHALDRASAATKVTPCLVLEALEHDAEERRRFARADQLSEALDVCGGNVEQRVERARARGQTAAAIALLERALRLDPGRDDLAGDLALLLASEGRNDDAVRVLAASVARDPDDPQRRVRLADAQTAAGQREAARQTIADLLARRPDIPEVRRAARALGLPQPLDAYRVDGRSIIRAFEAAAGRYAGPAVMVLDRAVTRVLAGGASLTLTHEIVRVDSKDAIDRWGEIQVPAGAEILTLRTYKPDGTTREPEEIAGKESVSAPDLAIGDYVEWELLETRGPSEAFAPGFLGDRFYFQSFDAPIARSELVLVTPPGMPLSFDPRAAAPGPKIQTASDGARVTTFAATAVPQLFAERSAVPAIEYVPSARPASGVGWASWARYLDEELHDAVRASPEVAALANTLAASAGVDRTRRAAAIVDWVTSNIEATDELAVPAGQTLARGRGSRVALTLALASELGLPAQIVLARSLLVADAAAPTPPEELDDFGDTLVRFDLGGRSPVYADLRLRHAAFGYVPPGLDGARTLGVADGAFAVAHSAAAGDQRTIDMTIRLDERGGGSAVATEELAGWPALEWAELVDRFGADRVRLREDFEQRWLGVQFPGARLRDLEVDVPHDATGRVGTARVRYSFVSAHLAVPVDRAGSGAREMRIAPTFFRSQPGRRFAAEPQRSTALMLGFDVPTRMTATVELPGAARLDAAGGGADLVVARAGGYRFVEARDVEPGRPNVIVLRRESTLPIMRVPPADYAGVAADLRRVDGAEQAEIRIRLGTAGHGAGGH
jgi:tetratricopeptide (TPR) repeat protein